jgi:flagellin-like hook-associated protein FlgL
VVFRSAATNLVAGSSGSQVYRKDLLTGEVKLVSASSSGAPGSGYYAAVSGDGRYVSFSSNSAALVSGDGNSSADVFVKDLLTGDIVRATTTSSGVEADTGGGAGAISADGRYIVFNSSATNLPGANGSIQIYRKDLQTGELLLISSNGSGQGGNGASTAPVLSANGRYVVFESAASDLVSGDSGSTSDIFMKDLVTGLIQRVSTGSSGSEANGGSSRATVSDDGRYVVFSSAATNLVSGDNNGRADIFIKDVSTGEIRRLSVSQSGREATNSAGGLGCGYASISGDGRYVFFASDLRDLLDGSTTAATRQVYATANPIGESSLTRFQWVNVKTQNEALNAMAWLDSYLNELNNFQGSIGSSMSRLDVAKENLFSMSENYSAAESRIRDADIAAEAATMVRSQILQQVASSVLGQANQAPQIALSLLRNAGA